MGKQSGFLLKLQENQRQNMHLQRLFTIQQCEDMALITLGQDFGFGEKRATEFLEKFRGPLRPTPLCVWRTPRATRIWTIPRAVSTGSWRASWAAPSSPGRCGTRRKCLVENDYFGS